MDGNIEWYLFAVVLNCYICTFVVLLITTLWWWARMVTWTANPNPRLYHDIIWSVSLANPPRYPQVSALTGVVSERYQIHIMGFLYEPMCYGVWPNASTSIVHGTSPKESRASRHTKRELIQTTIYINHVRPCLFNFFFLSFQWFLLVPIAPLGWESETILMWPHCNTGDKGELRVYTGFLDKCLWVQSKEI